MFLKVTNISFLMLNSALELIEIQKNSGTQRNLVLFHDINFGQEYGLAYIDKKTEKKLFSLFDIGVLDW